MWSSLRATPKGMMVCRITGMFDQLSLKCPYHMMLDIPIDCEVDFGTGA